MSASQDEIPPPPPPPPSSPQTPTQQTPHTVSTIKLPILKKGEYDIWAMKMEHYLAHTDYPIWEVIQNGNGPVSITTDTQGQIKVLPPRTAEEIVARERERKARTTLLMALPEDHLAKFHFHKDITKRNNQGLKMIGGGMQVILETMMGAEQYKREEFKGISDSLMEKLGEKSKTAESPQQVVMRPQRYQVDPNTMDIHIDALKNKRNYEKGCFQHPITGKQGLPMLNFKTLMVALLLWSTMAVLDSCPKHNMVAYVEKSEGNAEFHEIIDFLNKVPFSMPLTGKSTPLFATLLVATNQDEGASQKDQLKLNLHPPPSPH
ncbi:hypothetical protein Tco_0617714 [Tanacetum coccineum]